MVKKLLFVLMLASHNSDEVKARGLEARDSYCNVVEEADPPVLVEGKAAETPARRRTRFDTQKYREAQAEVYGILVLSCGTACFGIIQKANAMDLECGTDVWNLLLRRYEPTMGISRIRLTLNALDCCGKFKESLDAGKDTDEYIQGLESSLQSIEATGKTPNLEEILVALMITSMACA